MNPYTDKKSFHFRNWQQKFIIPELVKPIVSAKKKGFDRIAKDRFNKLFFDLGLKADYEALMLRAYVIEAMFFLFYLVSSLQ
jgi:hypothetical protein